MPIPILPTLRRVLAAVAVLIVFAIIARAGRPAAATVAAQTGGEAVARVAGPGGPDANPRADGAVAAHRVLVVYVREGCPHCADAKRWLAEVVRQRPDIEVVLRDVEVDPAAMDALVDVSRSLGRRNAAVPTFVADGRAIVGFADAERSGPPILALLEGASGGATRTPEPPRTPDGPGAPDAPDGPVPPDGSAAFGSLRPGSATFSIAMGMLDGLNPCAMWALLYLLSMLLHLHDRARIAALAGLFVAVTSGVHALVMIAWFDLFALARLARPLERAAGVAGLLIGALQLKDAVAPGHGPSLSVPESAKPMVGARMRAILAAPSPVAAAGAVVVLALVVDVVELMCTAGFPAVFTATLARHVPDPTAARAHLALYIAG
ncbi:MAG: glutaredoxin family protein [Burkholderiaceae bacterium]|jgi:glutaredoxin|nr:glutaredoxin family protein [Burkholderiales bacterium]MCZ8105829.1 glutaredoxin family protein [Burkholderiales bacterium]MCZ8336751.1 glutaredoxin family protein [Burkholderiaceae bacterium]